MAMAQGYRPGAAPQRVGPDAGEVLRDNLTTLGQNPRSLPALLGAGRAAIQSGDGQAALNFFSRADELAPRNPSVKAGMASAFVLMEQPRPALNLFAEAQQLGLPEIEIARDRGLAYDLLGNPRQAQQDYTRVLSVREDAEVRRRLALSLAISGEKDAALRAIDQQLRQQNRAAWRTRALVHAVTGDMAAADLAARVTMPLQTVQAMTPFLARLATLSPQQKAAAVHFGHFPADGRPLAGSSSDVSAYPGALALVGAAPSATTSAPVRTAQADPTVRSRGRDAELLSGGRVPARQRRAEAAARRDAERRASAQPPVQVAQAAVPVTAAPPPVVQAPAASAPPVSAAAAPAFTPPPASIYTQPPATAPATPPPASIYTQPVAAAPAEALPLAAPRIEAPAPVASATLPPSQAAAQPAFALNDIPSSVTVQPAPSATAAAPPVAAIPAAPAEAAPAPSPTPRFSQIAALVSALPTETEQNPATPRATTPTPAVPRTATRDPARTSTFPGRPSAPRAERTQTAEAAPTGRRFPGRASAPRTETEEEAPATTRNRSGAARTRTAAAETPATTRGSTRTPARPAHPARHWVQVAGGADRAALPREFQRLRGIAPDLLGTRTPYVTPLRATNRLLVGPFDDEREARELVNLLARKDLSAFTFTSEEGQVVERLSPSRR